jgi:hypothetical protein
LCELEATVDGVVEHRAAGGRVTATDSSGSITVATEGVVLIRPRVRVHDDYVSGAGCARGTGGTLRTLRTLRALGALWTGGALGAGGAV